MSQELHNTTYSTRLNIPQTPNLQKLGYGTGVNVWAKKNPVTQSPWALKNVSQRCNPDDLTHYQNLVKREVLVLQKLNHENIIGYRGELVSTDGRTCLAMERCGGSLGDIIEEKDEPFLASEILKVIRGVTSALNYLHVEKKLLHGDIKSFNILVKDNLNTVKLCDFGVCVELDEHGEATEYTGTNIYLAPECFIEPKLVTPKTDMFSVGLVIYEMITLTPPHCRGEYDESITDSSFNSCSFSSDLNDSLLISPVGTRPVLPDWVLNDPEYNLAVKIFIKCTEAEPSKRPSAKNVLDMISSI